MPTSEYNRCEEIPSAVLDTLRIRFLAIHELQRVKREFVRVYGRERGLWEYLTAGRVESRRAAAHTLRETCAILKSKGYCPLDVQRLLLTQAGITWDKWKQ